MNVTSGSISQPQTHAVPTATTHHGPDRPDYLAGALLQGLMRPMTDPFAPRLLPAALVALVTLGIGPLIQLPRRLHGFAARERDQLWHLAEWLRGQYGADADVLDPRTVSLDRVIHVLRLISWAGALAALGAIVWYLQGRSVERLLEMTYGYFRNRPRGWRDEYLFTIWSVGLCIGYGAQWVAVQVHQSRVRRFIDSFNGLAQRNGLAVIDPPPDVLGLRPMWLIVAGVFLFNGVLWGVPLMLAGAAQNRYIRHRSRWARQELAQRVRDVLRIKNPQMLLTVPVVLRRKCPVNLCQAPLPQAAVFCPRCGTRVAAVDRVA